MLDNLLRKSIFLMAIVFVLGIIELFGFFYAVIGWIRCFAELPVNFEMLAIVLSVIYISKDIRLGIIKRKLDKTISSIGDVE